MVYPDSELLILFFNDTCTCISRERGGGAVPARLAAAERKLLCSNVGLALPPSGSGPRIRRQQDGIQRLFDKKGHNYVFV